MKNKYLPLSKVRFLYPGHYLTQEDEEKIYQDRLNSISTLNTNLYPLLTSKDGAQSNKYPIFMVTTFEIMQKMAEFAKNSEQIRKIAKQLPATAKSQFLDSLLLSEITYTNKIEGVETNEYEISILIKEGERKIHTSSSPIRLRSTVMMYLANLKKSNIKIERLADFRNIYDKLLDGEIIAEKLPNGRLFRDVLPDNEILSIGTEFKTVHEPPRSEAEINTCLLQLIDFMNDGQVPDLIRAIITHFFFENTHPFLDGNGRMGRYLLSTYLSRKFDYFTGFSVATAIHSQVQSYYKIFREADQLENKAELTFFVQKLIKILIRQQYQVIEALETSKHKLDLASQQIKEKIHNFSDPESAEAVLMYLAESKLFTANLQLGIKDEEIIQKNSKNSISQRRTKKIINELEEKKLITKISGRPKQHIIDFVD
ncbi:Fic family protein [Lactobacillus colini]|uniref:Fic family protein n=1 Tax=Lactobacillus colini TaxID=1819254 RepID=A0ABS4MCL6_9LACO|nr:Fic family protein [Lactobacillus colini]MBP2057430.1 Fic family protein [Lactobacillus colini]